MMEVSIIQKTVHQWAGFCVDWFLCDRDLHHERVRVNCLSNEAKFIGKSQIKPTGFALLWCYPVFQDPINCCLFDKNK